jgi:hypothetical protein
MREGFEPFSKKLEYIPLQGLRTPAMVLAGIKGGVRR